MVRFLDMESRASAPDIVNQQSVIVGRIEIGENSRIGHIEFQGFKIVFSKYGVDA
jgi:carbonic anhydrase/acetyltransferase-like protein (isoleucine patch superfamily)